MEKLIRLDKDCFSEMLDTRLWDAFYDESPYISFGTQQEVEESLYVDEFDEILCGAMFRSNNSHF